MSLCQVLTCLLAVTVSLNCAQGQRSRDGGGGKGKGKGPDRILETLDGNRDGVLSAEELQDAGVALSELDTNGDGQLHPNEWNRRNGGGPDGPVRRPRSSERRPDPPRRSPPPPLDDKIGGFDPLQFLARVFSHDKNGDDLLSKEELPEALMRLLDKNDTNKDEALSKAELKASLERLKERFRASKPRSRDGRGRPRPQGRR